MKTISTIIVVVLFSVLLSACSSPVMMTNSSIVPGAQGEVKLKKDDNNNTVIKMEVKHLAPPEKLSPSRSVYLVWVESPDGKVVNLGQLKVDEDFEGEFEGTTPFEYFRIIVTAEDAPTATAPGLDVVLSTARMKP